jgi:tyrosyl-tRNA synthetase
MSKNILHLLCKNTDKVIPQEELASKLASKKELIVKFGADPTAPDLHLGHVVVLQKLRQFQDLGHHVIFLIGDFTARIGDPTGRSKTRPPLSEEQIAHNTQTYFKQVMRILSPERMTVRYNSEWLDKITSKEWLKLCAQVTLARLIEREDFAKRLSEHQPIGFHELLYPMLQGYDSVELKADVELGGTDQTFNLLMGRFLQEAYGQQPQVVMTLPLLEGLDGVQKMSKSLGNAIGLNEPADQAYGKIMSISDHLMYRYYALLLHISKEELDPQAHPMTLKKQLAHAIIKKFWNPEEADAAQSSFEKLFQKKELDAAEEINIPATTSNPISIIDLVMLLNGAPSKSEAKRLIQAGAVSADGEKITDFQGEISHQQGMVIRIGKHRFYKIKYS